LKMVAIMAVWVLLVAGCAAVPTTGVASAISSNNFTSTATGVTGSDAWIHWGQASGVHNWNTGNVTATAGSATIQVWGAPLIGGRTVYFVACDTTGCGNERTASIPAVTQIPVPTYGDPLRRVMTSHFGIPNISAEIPGAYTMTGAPVILIWGIMYLCVFVGFWLRTRTVRLGFFMVLLTAGFILSTSQGLFLGMPSAVVFFVPLMAACLAGMVYSLMHK
jgi:hypothetical protein